MDLSNFRRAATVAALLVATSAASFGQKMPSKLAPVPTSTSVQTVNDPSFGGMPAIDLAVPTGWKMEGQMFQAPCTFIPSPVFRQYSPDGLLEFRAMPTFGWADYPNQRKPTLTGCLPFKTKLSAAEFLQKLVELIPGGVHVVGPMPVDSWFSGHAQQVAQNSVGNAAGPMTPIVTADTAALRIETMNGSFLIEQRLRVQLQCAVRNNAQLQPMMRGFNCWARVDDVRAPKGKLDALVAFVDEHQMIKNMTRPDWQSALMQRQQQQAEEQMAALRRQQEAASQMLKAQHDQFMETMQRNHEAFMAQQESSFRSSMNNANNAMNARSTAASDWVDYSLDQQTVMGPNGIAKVSSTPTHVWSSTTGNDTYYYGTSDTNANPNGVLPGNWVENQKVHGNGQPY
jgi:type II secretory pathway pseudopilin PulG